MRGKIKSIYAWFPFLLAGFSLTVLALGTRGEAPQDPVLLKFRAYIESLDPEYLKLVIGLIMEIWTFLSVGLILAYLIYNIIDYYRFRPGRNKGGKKKKHGPAFRIVSFLVFLWLILGIAYLVGRKPEGEETVRTEAMAVEEEDATVHLEAERAEYSEVIDFPDSSVEEKIMIVRILVWALAILLIVASLLIIIRKKAGQHSPKQDAIPDGRADILGAVKKARQLISLGDDLRDSIIMAWADMRSLFEFPDEIQGHTPRELEARLLALGAARDVTGILTGLFEKARYSTIECTVNDKNAALRALEELERHFEKTGGADAG